MSETSSNVSAFPVAVQDAPAPTALPLNEQIAQEVVRRASANQQANITRMQAAATQAHQVAIKTEGQLELLVSLSQQGAVIVTAQEISAVAQELIARQIG